MKPLALLLSLLFLLTSAYAESSTSTVRVISTKKRIEEGVRLEAQMFAPKEIPESEKPKGAFTTDKLETIVGKFANRNIPSGKIVVFDDVADRPPMRSFSVPAGYRVLSVQGVCSEIIPKSWSKGGKPKADILLGVRKGGQFMVRTVLRSVQVLAPSCMKAHEKPDGTVPVMPMIKVEDEKLLNKAKDTPGGTLFFVSSEKDQLFAENETVRFPAQLLRDLAAEQEVIK